jgi:hypothetical protein
MSARDHTANGRGLTDVILCFISGQRIGYGSCQTRNDDEKEQLRNPINTHDAPLRPASQELALIVYPPLSSGHRLTKPRIKPTTPKNKEIRLI